MSHGFQNDLVDLGSGTIRMPVDTLRKMPQGSEEEMYGHAHRIAIKAMHKRQEPSALCRQDNDLTRVTIVNEVYKIASTDLAHV